MLNGIRKPKLASIYAIVLGLTLGAMSPNHGAIAQKVEHRDAPTVKDASAEFAALRYFLVTYRGHIEESQTFRVRIYTDAASEHEVVGKLAAGFPKLKFSEGAPKDFRQKVTVLSVRSMKQLSPGKLSTDLGAQWGPRDGLVINVVMVRAKGSWTITRSTWIAQL